MAVDTRFVVDSFALCSRFAALGITEGENALLPRSYQRVQTNYLKQNRKELFAVNYGDTNKRFVFPESLNVLASCYLKATLPENASANYKTIPGLWVIKTVVIRSNGDLVMSVPYQTLLQDHFASLLVPRPPPNSDTVLVLPRVPLVPAGFPFRCPTLLSGCTEDEDKEPTRSSRTGTTSSRSLLTSTRTQPPQRTAPT